MAQIVRAEIAVSFGIDEKSPQEAVVRHSIPVATFMPGGSVYLTPQENEAALRAAATAFAAALPTNRGYNIAAHLVSEAKTPA
ncbi:hypothetical protein B7P34_04815 [Streptosporangium nondiastaticum]|uniref:Uncharacterized protein n=1 Tax=Streptosporangium nondiastaticum TaxID=35764 RepID=A0A9X7JTW9_9ACTN|nr:hypothetical protein [Streptosporangium nondiastaticum]PSJ29835.1 hypothetical protein B7P34_04815 [Streptosporangium nondiastaticum]